MADETDIVVDEETTEETSVEPTPMEEFISKIKSMTTEYGVETSDLVVTLAIEQFETIRNYPSSYTDEMKIADMRNSIAKIAMAVVEIDAKDGAEGQLTHSESGYSRTYSQYIMAYKDVIGFANVL